MGNPDWNCPLIYHSKIQQLCRCRASHSLILSLSHQVKTNTRFARACFPADVPNYAFFSCLHRFLHQMILVKRCILIIFSTVLHLLEYDHLPSEGEVFLLLLLHELHLKAFHRNQFPSLLLVAGL